MKKRNLLFSVSIILSVFFFIGCKDPYAPELKYDQTNFLIVEGYIDAAAPTVFTLSRSRILYTKDTARKLFETGARIAIEDDKNNIVWLTEAGNGVYTSIGTLNLNPNNKYRARIFTKSGGGGEYVSDFVDFKTAPAIDNIGFKIKGDNKDAEIYVNTHDPAGQSKYYRWSYDETWEFHVPYDSRLRYDALTGKVVDRNDEVRICWRSQSFNKILIGNSTKLSQDIITEMPLVLIPNHSEQLSVLYSINVRQYVLDVNGYNFWEAMKKNTEEVGSIFDPQPNQTLGNIHSVKNADEPVVGYISAGKSSVKRVFIRNSELPPDWNKYPECPQIIVDGRKDSIDYYFGSGDYYPINTFLLDNGREGYTASYPLCVDCTLKGTNVKPSYWP